MLKSLMLGAAMMIAAPALAQTSGTSNADMNKPGSSMSNTTGSSTSMGQTMGQSGTGTSSTTAGSSADSGWGTTGSTSSTASSMGAGTSANGTATWNSGSAGYTGQGGPAMGNEGGRSYPACSRTVRDNCMQRGGRSHARRGR
ncbi:MAG TPA: hypothetical protein VGC56_15480 [Allosphingosinicella sp.]